MSTVWTKIGKLTTASKFLTALILMAAFETGYANLRASNALSSPLDSMNASDLSCMKVTNYNLPSAENYSCANKHKIAIKIGKNSWAKICPAAAAAARMQGSIHLTHNGAKYIYRSSKTVEKIPKGCSTTTGAAGVCLIPYIHVAADPQYYNFGDIIEVPHLKGVMIPHPNGKGMMPHPGVLIVADTGGRIKGEVRFDAFIGPRSWMAKENPFGPSGLKMTDETKCIMGFRKINGESQMAQAMKTDLKNMINNPNRLIAMATLGGRR